MRRVGGWIGRRVGGRSASEATVRSRELAGWQAGRQAGERADERADERAVVCKPAGERTSGRTKLQRAAGGGTDKRADGRMEGGQVS